MPAAFGTLKRLRVRLRATDPDALAETFGGNVSEEGVFLKSKQLLPIGTPVLLELLYQSGNLALRGRGTVAAVSTDPSAGGMHLALEWADESIHLVQWVIGRHAPSTSDPFEDVTVFAGDGPPETWMRRRDSALSPIEPIEPMEAMEPTPPPLPAPVPAKVAGQRPGSTDTWDLISDLFVGAPPTRSDLERAAMVDAFAETSAPSLPDWGSTLYSKRRAPPDPTDPPGPAEPYDTREAGEVTPLARIELVRTQSNERIRTGDIEPLETPESVDEPKSTAILSKRSPAQLAPPSAGIMAIDFGTVNTRAAAPAKDGIPRIIESRRGTESIPSAVMIEDSGKTIIGEPALRKLPSQPHLGIIGIRRMIGLAFASDRVQRIIESYAPALVAGEEGETAVRAGGSDIAMEEIAALLLKEVRESALMALEQRVNRAVLTVPSVFGFRQREAMLTAARLAGFHVDGMVSEAAAIAVHAAGTRTGKLFVYRFGGGTFDASLVDVSADRVEVIASESELFLGGVDLDAAMGVVLAEEVVRSSGIDPRSDPAWLAMLLEAARRAKHLLTYKDRATVFVEAPAGAEASFRIEVDVTRQLADRAWAPLIDRTLAVSERVLRSCGFTAQQVDGLVLAGGASRTRLVQEELRAVFAMDPIEVDPERAAVLGAAEIAARIMAGREIQIRERLATSLYVAEPDAAPLLLLKLGASLPAVATFTVRGPQTMICEGVQVGSEEALEPVCVARVEPFTGAAELRFDITAEGLLAVTASDPVSRLPLKVQLMTDLTQPRSNGGLFGWIKKRFKTGRTSLEK